MLFKSITTFATFALSAVSVFAAPTAEPEAAALVKKTTPISVPQALASAAAKLTPLSNELGSIVVNNLTVEVISPILSDISFVLNELVADVLLVSGQEASIALAVVNGTATVTTHDLAVAVSQVVHLVLVPVGTVFSLLSQVADAVSIKTLLYNLGQLVGTAVITIIQVTQVFLPGLAVAISALLLDLTYIITQLGLTILAGLIGVGL